MSKAILILDNPTTCEECPIGTSDKEMGNAVVCRKFAPYLKVNPTPEVKPSWCPLKSMPEKTPRSGFDDLYHVGEKNGWNAAIDAIGGNDSDGE